MSLSALSRWVDAYGNRIVLIGEREAKNNTIAKQHAKLFAKFSSCPLSDGATIVTQSSHDLCLLGNSGPSLSGESLVEIDIQIGTKLTKFLFTAIDFWRPLQDDVDTETETQQIREFHEKKHDDAWRELFATVDHRDESVSALLASLREVDPEMNLAIHKLLNERLQVLKELRQKAQEFMEKFSDASGNTDATLDETYGHSFFRAANSIQHEVITAWTSWAESLGHMIRDLPFYVDLVHRLFLSGAKKASEQKLIYLLEHNMALSIVEILGHCGFVCAEFHGYPERIIPSNGSPIEGDSGDGVDKKACEKFLRVADANVDVFGLSGKMAAPKECSCCGMANVPLMACSRCKAAQYCGIECQKKAWKHHKKSCASS
eukprot:TRINITY_DN4500_c0_g2_i1.p1 TRINITY_DN4500_c0_g2~~TRINITY_DN4500_c0_g2_i1.p1  ORF type:complete len:375 (-),score=88.04 TRINITY_DN4500_c0_g2_i1:203-1327(-)